MPTLLALDRVLTRPTKQALGRYQLLGRLGAGGMAEVFVARCGELDGMQSLVAVKRILPHLAEDERFVSLFRREAMISLRLRHRAIARVVEVGCADAAWFLAMELVPGESLAHLLLAERERGIAADPRVVAWVGAEIASALHCAHTLSEAGTPLPVIHRDVSPQNLLLGFDGAAKLIDFGVARCAQLSDATRSGTVRGKLAYASPEQLGARPLDGRSDLFSLAVVLHEWLAGRPLFACDNDAATLQSVLAAEIPPLPRAPRLGLVLARALARLPERRYPDGEAFAEALLDAVGGRPPSPERLVAAHLHALFPDREARWQAIVTGRPVDELRDGARVGGGTERSGSVLDGSDHRLGQTTGSTRLRRRRRRAAGVALATCAGFVALMVGWVHRTPLSTARPVPVISERSDPLSRPRERARERADLARADRTPADLASSDNSRSRDPLTLTLSPADGGEGMERSGREGMERSRGEGTVSPLHAAKPEVRRGVVHHHPPPAARRAVVDELEPSPYARR
jgi:serine/threonine-protein kinase